MRKGRWIACMLAAILALAVLTGCSATSEDVSEDATERLEAEHFVSSGSSGSSDEPMGAGEETWTIYWYLCGSDLESNGGAASVDIDEIAQVQLPENVEVVIQTGGAAVWQNDFVDPAVTMRFLYNSEGLQVLEELPAANFGEAQTLADFLQFCTSSYPAEREMLLFWNHGGGSVSGAAFDEAYANDSLSLAEMGDALSAVLTPDPANPPLEMVGFDTCLMSTIDTARTFQGYARYLVASEETEPACGWEYAAWLGALAQDPTMDGAQLGTVICDTYQQGCESEGVGGEITLAVTDLGKLDPLLSAYDALGAEAVALAVQDPVAFFSEYTRRANASESYGGNSDDEGYTNMLDLGHLVRNSADLLPQNAQAVLDALDACVVYKINGPYRQEATGLSSYYSFNGDPGEISAFLGISPGDAFGELLAYAQSGELDPQYAGEMGYDNAPTMPSAADMNLEDHPLDIDVDGNAVLEIGSEAASMLSSVCFDLSMLQDGDASVLVSLGTDNDIHADWENGVFTDNFRGKWGAIDGHICHMNILFESLEYNMYTVPILLNGEPYNLHAVYDFGQEAYSILGARKGLDETGMADKNMRQLAVSDTVTLVQYINEDGDEQPYEGDTFEVTETTGMAEMDLPDGSYGLIFYMKDIRGIEYASEAAIFTVQDGRILTSV